MIQLLENSVQTTPKHGSNSVQSLFEQYRPSHWGDVVGQDKAINKINVIKRRGLSGKAYMITGASGTGKTTFAHLIAHEVTSDYEEIDATTLTPKQLKDIESHWDSYGLFGGKAFIINESHGLNRACVRQLLVMLERIPAHVVVIFTTTSENQALFEDMDDASPFLSRTIHIALSRQAIAAPFAEKTMQIAIKEGLNSKELKQYMALAKKYNNNFRAMLQAVECGDML